jgi:hypothetical protein
LKRCVLKSGCPYVGEKLHGIPKSGYFGPDELGVCMERDAPLVLCIVFTSACYCTFVYLVYLRFMRIVLTSCLSLYLFSFLNNFHKLKVRIHENIQARPGSGD